jgi:hypothetical protein
MPLSSSWAYGQRGCGLLAMLLGDRTSRSSRADLLRPRRRRGRPARAPRTGRSWRPGDSRASRRFGGAKIVRTSACGILWLAGDDDTLEQLHVITLGENAALEQPVVLLDVPAGVVARTPGGETLHDRRLPLRPRPCKYLLPERASPCAAGVLERHELLHHRAEPVDGQPDLGGARRQRRRPACAPEGDLRVSPSIRRNAAADRASAACASA